MYASPREVIVKIGLIAGAGELPQCVVSAVIEAGHPLFVAALEGYEPPRGHNPDTESFGIAEFGRMTKTFRRHDCTHVCFAGHVERPDFQALKPDLKGLKKLPGAIKAARLGDDNLLQYVMAAYEDEGFVVISPQELCKDSLLPAGAITTKALTQSHRDDAEKACRIALNIGELDIGQGAVVCDGLVLAVEAQEGTDRMLERVANLSPNLIGTTSQRRGVLAKMLKPGQDDRIDLPTIGPRTIELAGKAGLAGIVCEAGKAFIMSKDKAVSLADELGLFVVGLPPKDHD